MNQFTDEQLDPRPYAAWKRQTRPLGPRLARDVLDAHSMAVLVAAWHGKHLIPRGGAPFNHAAHAADIAKAVEAQRAEQPQ